MTDIDEVTDPRPAYSRALDQAVGIARSVRPDQFGLPTPCTEMDVRELLVHLHMVIARAGALPTLADLADFPQENRAIADDGIAHAIAAEAEGSKRAWADDALLTRDMTLPWMTGPGADVLGIYLSETVVHSWDLATAVGNGCAWDQDVAAQALAALTKQLPMAERGPMWAHYRASLGDDAARQWADPFADAVDVAAAEPAMTRLIAWTGRQP